MSSQSCSSSRYVPVPPYAVLFSDLRLVCAGASLGLHAVLCSSPTHSVTSACDRDIEKGDFKNQKEREKS